MTAINKTGIMALVLLLAVFGSFTGYKYYKFYQEDTGLCKLCHMTGEGYRSWEASKHYQFICQQCHVMSIMEGNKLLMGHYVQGQKETKQSHGRENPWKECLKCHDAEATQGSITFRSSYGHARHVFMNKIGCESCHSGKLHDMRVDATKCQKCHADKLVHGMGTTGTFCLNCHGFKEQGHKMTSSERCYKCHTAIPKKGIMSKVECHDCHHPHDALKFDSAKCLGACHSSETKVGQHKRHIEKSNLKCTDCHKPHGWEVTRSGGKGLCDKCHKYKDPATFIY